MSATISSGAIVATPPRLSRPAIDLAPASNGDTAAALAGSIGRETADLAAILFTLPMRPYIRTMYEAEIQDEVAAIFSDADMDPAEAENCRLVAWLAFDRRLAVHAIEVGPYEGVSHSRASRPGIHPASEPQR